MGEFKQEIMKVNNRVNMDIFNQGLKHQKVEVIQNMVLIHAHNHRVKVLHLIDKSDTVATRMMDLALIDSFKTHFTTAMEEHFGIKILAHLKDYAPQLELSVSITIFDKPVEELLSTLKVQA